MREKLCCRGLSIFRVVLTAVLCMFSLASVEYVSMTTGELFSYFYCFATAAFVVLPLGLCVLFRWRMNLFFYLLFSFYAFGPLLGAVYNFYYFTSWWDDLLHLLAGTVFAVTGAQLAYVLNKKNQTSYLFAALFGVLLSMGIAVVWEMFEYSSDVFLNSDMQADTVIDAVFTKINRTDGLADAYENITETVVNGQSLGITGYLDIGLIDTMHDMIIETAGALIFLLYVLIDRNKHPMTVNLPKASKD